MCSCEGCSPMMLSWNAGHVLRQDLAIPFGLPQVWPSKEISTVTESHIADLENDRVPED